MLMVLLLMVLLLMVCRQGEGSRQLMTFYPNGSGPVSTLVLDVLFGAVFLKTA